jgi:DNA-binding transcriptional LysR family regulator
VDLRRLRYFIGIAEHGGFHRAAAQLNIAQPALTRQIRELEQELGVSLLIRSVQGVTLSPAGEVLLAEVKRLLPQIEMAANKTKRAALGQFGLVRIAFSERISELRRAVAAFSETRRLLPDVDFHLSTINSDDQMKALVAGDIDVGVLFRPPPYPHRVQHRHLRTYYCKLLVNKGHPLTKMSRVRLSDLQSFDMAMVARSVAPVTHSEMLAAFARGGLSPKITFEVNSEATLVNLVEVGIAIGLADPTLIERHTVKNSILLDIVDFEYPVHLVVLWHKDRETPAILKFADQLSKRFEAPRRGARSRHSS